MLEHELVSSLVSYELSLTEVSDYSMLIAEVERILQSAPFLESLPGSVPAVLTDANCIVLLGKWVLNGFLDNSKELAFSEEMTALISRTLPGVQLVFDPLNKEANLQLLRHLGAKKGAGPLTVRAEFDSTQSSAELSSLFRAEFPPGAELSVFIQPGVELLPLKFVQELISQASSIFFNSTSCKSFVEHRDLLKSDAALIDARWLGLVFWREAIKQLFIDSNLSSEFGSISRVECNLPTARSNSGTGLDEESIFLLLGWIIDSLSWEPGAYFKRGFECSDSEGRPATVQLAISERVKNTELSFCTRAGNRILTLESRDNQSLTALLQLKDRAEKRIFPLSELSSLEAYARYLMIGESVTNYRKAMLVGAELSRLWGVF